MDEQILSSYIQQARRKQLESGAAKTKEILKTHSRRVFIIFLFKKNLILTGKKHCGESRRCHNASTGPVQGYDLMGFY